VAFTPIQREIGRIAADYRRYLILRGLSAGWACIALLGGLLLLAFHWRGISIPGALIFVPIAGLMTAALCMGGALRMSAALREIARKVEKDDPKLNSLLLAALEQEPDAATGELGFLQARVVREALEANRRSPWHQKFSERLFFAQAGHLALLLAAVAALGGLAMIRPGSPAFAARAFGVEITPGNVAVEKGNSLAVLAKFGRGAPREVRLVTKTTSGGEKSAVMARSLNDAMFGFTLPELREKTEYRIEFDGRETEVFTAEVFEHPELQRADAELDYPKYTGFAPEKVEDTRRISAVEGTGVKYTFHLNKPVRSARLLETTKEAAKGTNLVEIALTNSVEGAAARVADFKLAKSGNYRLELVDTEGRTNKLPADFVFVALENRRPKLKLITPRGDQRVSALQEVKFEGQAEDDFGMARYGLAYTLAGGGTETVAMQPGEKPEGELATKPNESVNFAWLLDLEKLGAEPGQLASYYLWAEDLGPDGEVRRTEGDMFFAEVRPFEEIFRQGQEEAASSQQQQQQQGGGNQAGRLLELQKEIITAAWNLQRRENKAEPSTAFKQDAEVVRSSQTTALGQAEEMRDGIQDGKSQAYAETAITSMRAAEKHLAQASDKNSPGPLPEAVDAARAAYQALLKLQAREFQVTRNRGGGGGGGGGQQRAQRQLDQLELKEDEKRYESESQASPLQNPEQRESLQVLNRLKELARRQQDMSERLKELQTALNEAKTEEEKEKIERMLKRLQEEQQQIVQDMDELRQRMAQPENQSRMAEARQQLDQTRQQTREASRQLENENVGQAISSSARAEQELRELADQFRKSTSNQFSEEMQSLRQQARELEKQSAAVEQKMEAAADSRPQRTLGGLDAESPRQQALDALSSQRSALTNLLQDLRQVTEQAEAAEPLLSRQLYETLRRASQQSPEKSLEAAGQLLERNLPAQAAEAREKAEETIRSLKEGVERAANSVLGDEAESLQFAERELNDLAERLQREMDRAAQSAAGTNQTEQAGEQTLSSMMGEGRGGGTNRLASAGREGQAQLQRLSERGQGSQGQETGEQGGQPGQGEPGEGQQGQQGQGGEGSNSQAASAGGNQPGENLSEGQPGGQNPGNARGEGPRRLAEGQQGQPGNQRQGGNLDGGNAGGGGFERGRLTGGAEGPLTGRDFNNWSDRLRDLEEVLQNPGLRGDVAQVRDRARAFRADVKRHASEPQWDLVEAEVIKPLRILQNRVAEDLARHRRSDAVVPLDRDPVPQKYSDLVSRYYETLGKD